MKKINLLLAILIACSLCVQAQKKSLTPTPAKVDFDAFEKLTEKVKKHRQNRLITLDKFLQMSKEKNVIILDARSDAMYTGKHIKGAVHLNFSDFTQENLAEVIPSFDTKVLIYCNNNFINDETFFPGKEVKLNFNKNSKTSTPKPITLALNIPTYINLYGYGYKNVYELSELISVFDKRIELEGTAVGK